MKKIKPDGSKTLYVGGIYEVDKNSGGSVTGTKTYYPAGGAMRVGSTLYYVLKDHLGSASVVTDNIGTIVGEDRFYPFGETRFTTGTMFTDKLFTGQREITGLGIYHYGARFYSPKLGRFLSADTIVPGYTNPQNLNRYSYVRNNPLRYTDPTGHRPDDGYAGTSGCSNSTYCSNGSPKSKQELARMRREKRNDNGGGGGGSTPTPTPTPTITPSLTSTPCIQASQACVPTSTPTPSPTSTAEFTIGNLPATSTPTATPTATSMPNNEFPVDVFVPSPLSWPPDFAPNADDIWDIIGGALPLLGQPATSIGQAVNNTVNTAINATRAISNALTNAGAAVNTAIGNGPYYGPVMPIFYLPPDPLFGPPTVYN